MKPKDDEKQRAIAEATFKLVAQTGFSGLTMADIAKSAGIATSTLYVYYPSKDALISQLYQDAKTATVQRLMAGLDADASVRSRLRGIWRNLLRHRLERYAEVVFQEQYYNSPWFTQDDRELSSRLSVGFLAVMAEGQRQEILKPVPFALLTASLLGSVRDTAQLIRSSALTDDEATSAAAFGLWWDGIKA